MNIKNTHNEYAELLGPLFDECPKSVLAAVAVSALQAMAGRECFNLAALQVAAEWDTLHSNGIVPQKPGKVARDLMRRGEG